MALIAKEPRRQTQEDVKKSITFDKQLLLSRLVSDGEEVSRQTSTEYYSRSHNKQTHKRRHWSTGKQRKEWKNNNILSKVQLLLSPKQRGRPYRTPSQPNHASISDARAREAGGKKKRDNRKSNKNEVLGGWWPSKQTLDTAAWRCVEGVWFCLRDLVRRKW